MPKFNLKHNPDQYFSTGVKLWFLRFYGRSIRSRLSLTFLVIIFVLISNLIISNGFLWGLGIVMLLLIIDLIVFLFSVQKEIESTQSYIADGGENISLYAGDHFSYIQDGKEFRKVEWHDIFEYISYKSSSEFLSFKSKKTKEYYIIYSKEIGEQSFYALKLIVESKIKVSPLVDC